MSFTKKEVNHSIGHLILDGYDLEVAVKIVGDKIGLERYGMIPPYISNTRTSLEAAAVRLMTGKLDLCPFVYSESSIADKLS